MIRSLILAGLVLLTAIGAAQAQSTFFNKGESGMGLVGGILSNDYVDGWQLGIGGSANGLLDFSARFARVEETNIWAFGLGWYIYRPRELAKPIAVSLGAGVELSEIKVRQWHYYGDMLVRETQPVNAQMAIIGVNLHSTLASSESALIELTGGVGFSKLSYDNSNREIEPVVSGGLPMVFGDSRGTRFMITPAINAIREHGKFESTFGLTIGILIHGGNRGNAIR